jgi:hypothetical protein
MENLRVTYPQYFEIDTTSDLNGSRVGKQYQVHSVELRSLCARVHDDVALFKKMTMSEDYFLTRSRDTKIKWSQRKQTTPSEIALGN